MEDPNLTMEEYIKLEGEKARRHDFPTIVFDDPLATDHKISSEPTVSMEDPNLTMEEYIELEAEKALRRGQTFNWETTTYGKVRYCEDINYFKDFETDFPAIVFDDPLATNHKILSEPTVSPLDDNGINFKLSFDESDDEAYTITYNINSFSYKLIFVNDLKLDSENDDNKVNISSNDVVIEQSDSGIDVNMDTQSHEFK
nr:hypothetical protein [Tanacetum cinerariifolium]